MGLCLQRNDGLDVAHFEVVGRGVVGGSELLHHRTLGERHVVLVGGYDLVRIQLSRLLDHGEQRRLHLLAVDDEGAAENLVAAVLGVDLGESEDFRIREFAAQLALHLVEILYLLWAQRQSFLLVVFLQVLDVENGGRLDFHGEHLLVQTFVHTLQHGVELSILAVHREILLYSVHAMDGHVLSDLHGVCTPRSDHLSTGAYKEA